MVVAKPQLAFLFAVSAFAVEQPLLLCSPGGRDGFGSQYFHHMAVFGACAAHGDCCYVHSSFQTLAHGADPRRAEAFTGLRSGDACRHLLSSPRRDETLPPDPEGASIGCSNGRLRREGATAGWRLSTIEWPRPAPSTASGPSCTTRRRGRPPGSDAAPKVGFPRRRTAPCASTRAAGTTSSPAAPRATRRRTRRCSASSTRRCGARRARRSASGEGRPEDFGPALATHPRVHWRLGGDPLHTFHELVTAPTLFVAAKSTFSAAAAVLNEGELLYAPLKAYAVHQAKQEHYNPLAACFGLACACVADAERRSWSARRRVRGPAAACGPRASGPARPVRLPL
ncbi:histone methylation protein DOT1 [Aureococcus anophagefferens]|nr:histone methylation protein DOT1 [Aureococcus anophagefferens]